MLIECLEELVNYYKVADAEELKKVIYDTTDSGVAMLTTDDGVELSVIVEGSHHDQDVSPRLLEFPFAIDNFKKALKEMEEEADAACKEIHSK